MTDNKYEAARRIEKAEGFDSAIAESIIFDEFDKLGISGSQTFPSAHPGVIAYERIDTFDVDDSELRAAFRRISERVGKDIVCIAYCDWAFDDRCDEEATWIAFDIPSLPDDYRDDHGNLVEGPETVVSP